MRGNRRKQSFPMQSTTTPTVQHLLYRIRRRDRRCNPGIRVCVRRRLPLADGPSRAVCPAASRTCIIGVACALCNRSNAPEVLHHACDRRTQLFGSSRGLLAARSSVEVVAQLVEQTQCPLGWRLRQGRMCSAVQCSSIEPHRLRRTDSCVRRRPHILRQSLAIWRPWCLLAV